MNTSQLTSLESTETFLREVQLRHGPIGGVFHLAAVLKDTLFENQTKELFQELAVAKYWTTLYLDGATRKLCGRELKW